MWPVLTGTGTSPVPAYVTVGQSGAEAYYEWPWKLIDFGGEYELYQLEDDPLETLNLAPAEPDKVTGLAQRLAATPRGENVHIPILRVIRDPDFFGGEEDRAPWADTVPY